MTTPFNPFLPGRPVPADLFIGRVTQLDRLAQLARQSAAGRLNTRYLAGDRGIGKTSLAAFLRSFMEREFGMLGVHVFLSGADTLEEAIQRVLDQILKVARQKHCMDDIKDLFGPRLATVGFGGVDVMLRASGPELQAIGGNFDTVVRSMMQRLRPRFRGMLLILDDLNDLKSTSGFAHWIKSFVDSASTNGADLPLFLLMAGYEETRQSFLVSNPSLDGILQAESLGPWSNAEATEFFRAAFEKAGVMVTPDAVRAMCNLCNGRPAMAHKLGEATLRGDLDGHITEDDALNALFGLDGRDGAERAPAAIADDAGQHPIPARRPAAQSGQPQLLRVLRSLI